MELLNIIGLILWSIVGFKCISYFIMLHEIHELKSKILVVIIMLLAGLNICRSFISVNLDLLPVPSLLLLSYFYLGTSVFQLLLSYCVLERVNEIIKEA